MHVYKGFYDCIFNLAEIVKILFSLFNLLLLK